MRFDILTLFPEMFESYLSASILNRAQESGLLSVHLHNIRDYAPGKHRVTDEPPYGGGGGMILKPEPVFKAVEEVLEISGGLDGVESGQRSPPPGHTVHEQAMAAGIPPVILLSPQGRLFSHKTASELAARERLVLLCGRYEGVDERIRQHLVTDEISIGDYVLSGGELAAMVVLDAVTRLIPGALGADGAAATDSYATGLLEGPHYTRPSIFRSWPVPEVLRSGHAANIDRWRREQALRRTWQRRPELLLSAPLSEEDRMFLSVLAEETVLQEIM
jgi:tRNA (guanine37-N1)-methyltransferase